MSGRGAGGAAALLPPARTHSPPPPPPSLTRSPARPPPPPLPLHRRQLKWGWDHEATTRNDYFLYSTPDCLAVGGAGHFALWVDAELLEGNSGACATFGSPCLASAEEFRVVELEVWAVGGG